MHSTAKRGCPAQLSRLWVNRLPAAARTWRTPPGECVTIACMGMVNFFTGMLLALVSAGLGAADCVLPERDLMGLPMSDGGSVEVEVHLYMSDLTEIDDARQSFVADVFMRAQWRDPRLVHRGTQPCSVADDAIWTPGLQVLNRRQLERIRAPKLSVATDGTVTQAVRAYGDFTFRADLTDFPFDQQELHFILVSVHGLQEVEITARQGTLGMGKVLSVANWDVRFREGRPSEHFVTTQNRSVSRLDVIFDAKRLTGFYTWQLLVPLFLVVMMTWTVFWMPLEFVAPRVGLVATSMLTLIAYRFSMSSILPPIAYLTRLDQFMVASSVLVFCALAAAVAVTYFEGKGQMARALRLNKASRMLAPALFLLVFTKVFIL